MRGLVFVLPVCLVACKGPPEAPQELDELVGYLYAHVPDDDPAALEAGAVNLDEWLIERIDETLEGYTVDNLDQETVDGLEDEERPLDDLAGAAVGHVSEFDVDELIEAQLLDDVDEIYPGTYVSYEREELTGTARCFVDHECDWYETEIWATQDFTFLTVETNSRVQYRWVETPDGPAMIQRNWTRQPSTVSLDWLEVEQQYYLWMVLPEGGGSRNIQSMWVVAKLSGDEVDPDLALNMVIDSMQGLSADLDKWVESK
ncbi:MAG: hypothetical protein ACOZNI_36320 [Myxococcota bacterium]